MEAITREEKIMSGENLTPITRKEMFLAKAAGMDVETPEPITREEMFLSKIVGGGSGGGGAVDSYYDYFWDEFQQNGNRANYWRGFSGVGWNPRTLKPKHLVKPLDSNANTQYAVDMFFRCNATATSTDYIDFAPIADKFDFSEVQRATNLFDSAKFDNVVADLSSAIYANSAFGCTWNAGVRSLKLKVTELLQNVDSMFRSTHLAKIEMMEGSVWAVSVDFGLCPLDKASITSIAGALSTTTSGLTVTFSKTAKESAFTASEWSALIATKPNWTISLA